MTQPWATLVALGAKRWETRSWPTNYRGPLAIHAAKNMPKWAVEICWAEPFAEVLGFEEEMCSAFLELVCPRGVVLAVVDLLGCWPTEALVVSDKLSEQQRSFGDYSPNRYGWRLANVRRLPEPIQAKGALGLWDWTPPAGWEAAAA